MLRHGLTDTKVHNIWRSMTRRCRDKTHQNYKWYGGKGIKVCERWHLFENFLEDMGMPPDEKSSIDRINGNADYYKDNCRWSNPIEQGQNKSSTKLSAEAVQYIRKNYRKTKQNCSNRQQLAKKFGVSVSTINRVVSGESWKNVE